MQVSDLSLLWSRPVEGEAAVLTNNGTITQELFFPLQEGQSENLQGYLFVFWQCLENA